MIEVASDQGLTPTASASAPVPVRWTFGTRVAFRFALCYFMLYALCCGNATIWEIIPFAGGYIDHWLSWPFAHAGQWLAQHWFHIQGVGAKLHYTGSGDTAIAWIAVGVMISVAVLATLLWTALDRDSLAYPKLLRWFRFTLRLALGYAMVNYGLAKLFPLQMAPPSLAVLNEPFGNISPMTLLWTMIGYNPVYEMICGAAEAAGGVLILFRRTALAGALLIAFLTANIVLFNFFFDVPVKLYAAHLLLMSLVVIVPDMRALVGFFWRHRATAPTVPWAPWGRRTIRLLHVTLELENLIVAVVLLLVAGFASLKLGQGVLNQRVSMLHPAPLTGQWHVDSATLNGQPKPFLTGDGLPMTDIFLEPSGRTMLRDSATVLWRAGVHVDDKDHTLILGSAGLDHPIVYAIAQPDPAHLVLTPNGKDNKGDAVLTLTRVPLPTHYPLLDRGFHWVNEWGLER